MPDISRRWCLARDAMASRRGRHHTTSSFVGARSRPRISRVWIIANEACLTRLFISPIRSPLVSGTSAHITTRTSHEGERATVSRIQDQPDRAPPHWLNPLVELSRCAASAFQHHCAYAILSQMAEAPISKSVVKQLLSGGILSLRADAAASRWTLLVKYGNISAMFLKGF